MVDLGQQFPISFGPGEARKTPRHQPLRLMCTLGEVADLSALGMRVRGQGKCALLPGQMIGFTLETPTGPVPLRGQVRWVQKINIFRYDVGVQFEEVASNVACLIESIAWTPPHRRRASA